MADASTELNQTIYKLSWGGGVDTGIRYFDVNHQCDAYVRLAEHITALDQSPTLSAAWVHLERLPDTVFPEGMGLVNWTKTSDERPTSDGETEILDGWLAR